MQPRRSLRVALAFVAHRWDRWPRIDHRLYSTSGSVIFELPEMPVDTASRAVSPPRPHVYGPKRIMCLDVDSIASVADVKTLKWRYVNHRSQRSVSPSDARNIDWLAIPDGDDGENSG